MRVSLHFSGLTNGNLVKRSLPCSPDILGSFLMPRILGSLSRRFSRLKTFIKTSIYYYQHRPMRIWSICNPWWRAIIEYLDIRMFGFVKALPRSTNPRCFTLTLLHLNLLIHWPLGYGNPPAPWKLKCLLGCSLWTDWTLKIWWRGGIGIWKMEWIVYFALC